MKVIKKVISIVLKLNYCDIDLRRCFITNTNKSSSIKTGKQDYDLDVIKHIKIENVTDDKLKYKFCIEPKFTLEKNTVKVSLLLTDAQKMS